MTKMTLPIPVKSCRNGIWLHVPKGKSCWKSAFSCWEYGNFSWEKLVVTLQIVSIVANTVFSCSRSSRLNTYQCFFPDDCVAAKLFLPLNVRRQLFPMDWQIGTREGAMGEGESHNNFVSNNAPSLTQSYYRLSLTLVGKPRSSH